MNAPNEAAAPSVSDSVAGTEPPTVPPVSLTAPLQVAGGSAAFANVGGSAAPTSLRTYSGPVSNDVTTVNFKQSIGANEALRTGTYAKTLTFTLSTTTP